MEAPRYVLALDSVRGSDQAAVGGKAASLGELISTGFRVPKGFVVTKAAFDLFLKRADPEQRVRELLAAVAKEGAKVQPISEAILEQIVGAEVPTEVAGEVESLYRSMDLAAVAVRSSANCEDGTENAWAGQLETYLNVSADELLERVRQCWLSAFSRRTLAYAAAHGFDGTVIGVAVVVQEMVPSTVSGIGFSVHPVTQEPDLCLVEACFGLGEAIVSGEVSPDVFVVSKSRGEILESLPGRQTKALRLEPGESAPAWQDLDEEAGAAPKLSKDQALEYARLLGRVEAHYGRPMDTEWAHYGGRFHLLQARPITTLAPGYNEELIDRSVPWAYLVKRPFSLVEYSIIGHWTDPEHAAADLGFLHLNRVLGIQDDANLTHMFLSGPGHAEAHNHLLDLQQHDRDGLLLMLRKGRRLFEEGGRRIEQRAGFAGLEEVFEYFCEVGKFTVVLPAWLLIALESAGIEDAEARDLAEDLRAHSVYPRLVHDLLHPFVAEHARRAGFSAPEEAPHLVSWDELRRGIEVATLEERLAAKRAGHHFVYQQIDDEVKVRFLPETGYLLMRLVGSRLPPARADADCLTGQTAWPGTHQGRARLVLSSNPEGYTVADGEVLVSVQSNPNLMPLLRHAGAIVTDEGGVACHASIVARELKVPAVTGTGWATRLIREGDLVEVDATAQTVRILERAQK
ncbi:MAG: PEP/pyruvate-binding domain-containing protein [Verrucomicrobiota bacterium]